MTEYDTIIIGGGPAGSTAGFYLAKAGLKSLIIEKKNFPRYSVGESLLPYNMDIFREMGFDHVLEKAGFMRKYGAIFGESNGDNITRIDFSKGFEPEYNHAYQVPRDQFDLLLYKHAQESGAETVIGAVDNPIMSGNKVIGVDVTLQDGSKKKINSKIVIDATGRSFFLSKKFDLLEADPNINSCSVYGLFDGINTTTSHESANMGDIIILAFEKGWFWFIPFSDGRTSVGVVTGSSLYDKNKNNLSDFFDEMVQLASGRVKQLLASAQLSDKLRLLSNFSKHSRQIAGEGWVLLGDSAMFVDPVYSAGIFVAMTSARTAANIIIEADKNNTPITKSIFKPLQETYDAANKTILPFIYCFRNPLFQRILFNPPPIGGKTAEMIITVMAGCFFKPHLIAKEHDQFWGYMNKRGIKPYKVM